MAAGEHVRGFAAAGRVPELSWRGGASRGPGQKRRTLSFASQSAPAAMSFATQSRRPRAAVSISGVSPLCVAGIRREGVAWRDGGPAEGAARSGRPGRREGRDWYCSRIAVAGYVVFLFTTQTVGSKHLNSRCHAVLASPPSAQTGDFCTQKYNEGANDTANSDKMVPA